MADTNILGYSIDLEAMKASTCGMIGFACKDGQKYFCKQFNDPVQPVQNGTMSPRLIAINQAKFDEFRKRKLRINTALRKVAGLGGNIIFPVSETIYNNHWFEFSEYVENTVPEDRYYRIISKLKKEEKLLVLKIAIAALRTIHEQKIVHGDLKLTNIMLSQNDSGHYVSKIIDFDGAFFEDDVPLEAITGTTDYYSPELAFYNLSDDPEWHKKTCRMITTKSDIFTMGLVLHEYLTGKKPEADHIPTSLKKLKKEGKFIYPWQFLLAQDKDEPRPQLIISEEITEPAYVALISDMLARNPADRPSAAEVMQRLNSCELPYSFEVWPEDGIILQKDKIKSTYIGFRRVEIPVSGKAPIHAYEVMDSQGYRHLKNADRLILEKLVRRKYSFETPWPEDHIAWDINRLKKQFDSIERDKTVGSYILCDQRGNYRHLTGTNLLDMGLAYSIAIPPAKSVVTPPPSPSSVLWAEDEAHWKLDLAALERFQLQFVEKTTVNGTHGYLFKMTNGMQRSITTQQCTLLKILVEKS